MSFKSSGCALALAYGFMIHMTLLVMTQRGQHVTTVKNTVYVTNTAYITDPLRAHL